MQMLKPDYYLYMQNDIQILSTFNENPLLFIWYSSVQIINICDAIISLLDVALQQMSFFSLMKLLRSTYRSTDSCMHKEKQQQQQQQQQAAKEYNVGGICQLLFPTLEKNLRFWLIEGRPIGVMCRIAS
ncbi:hypothetical protein T01_507 [Trichinella spiralis]|uniref:Uncharacterized protein n=1 Tax=Trichinella spiralis TaxID=6334 RepID=A0A0V1BYI9_TRISP|nr:hypothetical protein T01_507 [Trichinella spiralis]